MRPNTVNLHLLQGATFEHTIRVTDSSISLVGSSAQMIIREQASPYTTIATLTSASELTIDDVAKEILIAVIPGTSTAWTFSQADYQLEMTTSDTKVFRPMEGVITMYSEF